MVAPLVLTQWRCPRDTVPPGSVALDKQRDHTDTDFLCMQSQRSHQCAVPALVGMGSSRRMRPRKEATHAMQVLFYFGDIVYSRHYCRKNANRGGAEGGGSRGTFSWPLKGPFRAGMWGGGGSWFSGGDGSHGVPRHTAAGNRSKVGDMLQADRAQDPSGSLGKRRLHGHCEGLGSVQVSMGGKMLRVGGRRHAEQRRTYRIGGGGGARNLVCSSSTLHHTAPTPSSTVPYTAPTSSSTLHCTAPTPSSTLPYTAPTPSSTLHYTAPTPSSTLHYTAPTPSSTLHYTAPTPSSTLHYTAPTPSATIHYTAPTPSSTLYYTAPVPSSTLHYTAPTPSSTLH